MDITRKEAFILGYLHKQAGVKSLVKAGAKEALKVQETLLKTYCVKSSHLCRILRRLRRAS